jgi:SynChlorMet cassette protein ScmC
VTGVVAGVHVGSGFLHLGDGQSWCLEGVGDAGMRLLARLSFVMRLGDRAGGGLPLRLVVHRPNDSEASVALAPGVRLGQENGRSECCFFPVGRPTTCFVEPFDTEDALLARLISISYVFSRSAEAMGGLLVHGALAEWHGKGVILTGKSGVGKSTASSRLKAPWKSLCDDATLIVRAPTGQYMAHPWPTWSRLFDGDPDASWPVGNGVPLAGIFFISWAESEDLSVRPYPGVAAELLDLAYDCSWDTLRDLSLEGQRAIRLRLFENVCSIVRGVPCRSLVVTLTNPFWKTIERALAEIA